MPPSRGTQKKIASKARRRSARISQQPSHGTTAKKSVGQKTRQKRKDSVHEERPQSENSPRLEVDEDELAPREKVRSGENLATSERKADSTTASRDEVVDSNEREMTMDEMSYRNSIGAYLDGSCIGYHQGIPAKWPRMFTELALHTASFGRDHGIDMGGFNKLSKKDRQEIIESAKGYVIQGDADEVAARFQGAFDQLSHCLLGGFLSKYTLQKFLGNNSLFWWLEPDMQAKGTESVPSKFGEQLNSLYKEFMRAHKYLAYAWSMMTIRLSTVTELPFGDDLAFAEYMRECRKYLTRSIIVPELLASKTMRLLLNDAKDPEVLKDLQHILARHAEDAVMMYSYPFRVRFEGLENLPTDYLDLPESERADFKGLFHEGDDSPLHGKKVLAITHPASYCLGTIDSDKGERLISPGQFIIDWNYWDGRNLE